MKNVTCYIGDSVYIRTDPETNGLVIYTDNGDGPQNEIFINNNVWRGMTIFVRGLRDDI